MRAHLAVPVLVLLVSVGETAAAQSGRLDYPQWRGRDRDGAASGCIEPSAWPAELTRRWTVPVGQGYATPIVARAGRAGFDPVARHVVADSPTWAQPAVSGDRIFVKDVDTLTLWTVTPPPR